MRNTLRFLATVLAAALLVCAFCVTASAATTKFTDVDDNNETLSEAVALLAHLNVTKGTSDTTFGTNENVTRQQMAAFIYRLMKQGRTLEGGSNSTSFKDLTDPTFYGYVSWANQTGVIKGISDTEFNPTGSITLQDAYTMLVRALGYESEEMIYPYSYIDVAELEEVALDNELPSNIDYTSTLTRGNVAILLYNAFFAETGHEETYQREREIGYGDNTKWVLETKKFNPTLAEYVYDVEVGQFVVRATPKYAFNDSYEDDEFEPLYEIFDEDNLHLVAVENGEPISQFYTEFAGTGLAGKADDHIMTTVNVYYTYKTTNGVNQVDHVYFMSNELKTIETTEAKVSWKTVRNSEDYLLGSSNADPEGYLTVGSETIYFFDAPYSYIKPDYSVADTEDDRYFLRNEKDVKFIDIKRLDGDVDTYSWYITDTVADNPEEFYQAIPRVLAGGVYKMKFFDGDGDDVYEYLHYMPATFGKVDMTEDRTFADDMEGNKPIYEDAKGDISEMDLDFVPTIYTNEATLRGASFFDGDFVIAYLNPEANIMDVTAVVTPYKGYVSSVRPRNGTFKVDGKTFSIAYTYRTVEHLNGGCSCQPNPGAFNYHNTSDVHYFENLTNAKAIGEEFEYYVYNCQGRNNVLYYKHTGGKRLGFVSDKLIIPLRDEDALSDGEYWTESKFDGKLGERAHYTKVWLDGKETFVALDTEDMYPKLEYSNGKYSMSTPSVDDPSVSAYLEKIATYEVASDGRYIIKPLLHAYNEDGDYIGVNRDSSILVESDNTEQYGNDLGDNYTGKIEKVSSTRYKLVDESGETLLGDFTGTSEDAATISYFVLTKNSVIIIKNVDTRGTVTPSDDETEYLMYDMDSFGGETDDGVTLSNIQYILRGDADSATRAELLVLYAEARDFEFAEKKTKDGYRIVSGYTPGVDADGDYRNYYTLLNPFTGSVEEDIPGNDSVGRAENLDDVYVTGDVVEVKDNMVDESNEFLGHIDTASNESGLVWITEYDANDSFISVVPTAATGALTCCLDEFNDFIEEYTYEGVETNLDNEPFITATGSENLYYEITSDTTVTVLTSKKAGEKAILNGTYTLGDIGVIADGKKEYKCYNEKVVADDRGNYKTGYAPYLKAYVIAKEAKDEDDMPIAEHIIVVVNADEPTALLTKKCEADLH